MRWWQIKTYSEACQAFNLPENGTHTFEVCPLCGFMQHSNSWKDGRKDIKNVRDLLVENCPNCSKIAKEHHDIARWVIDVIAHSNCIRCAEIVKELSSGRVSKPFSTKDVRTPT